MARNGRNTAMYLDLFFESIPIFDGFYFNLSESYKRSYEPSNFDHWTQLYSSFKMPDLELKSWLDSSIDL